MALYSYRPGDSRGFAQKEEEEDEDLFQFGAGLSAGVDTTIGTLSGVMSLFNTLTGDEEEAMEYMGYARDRFQQAAESGGTVTQLEDIDGLGDVVRWATYSAGTILPSIATSIAGGGLGGAVVGGVARQAFKGQVKKEVVDSIEGRVKESVKNRRIREVLDGRTRNFRRGGQIAGAGGASIAQNTGATFVDIYEETGIEAPDVALAAGIVSGALDSLVPLAALKRVMPGSVFARFKDELSDKVVQNGGATRRILQKAGKGGGLEAATEAAQEWIQATAVGMMRNDPQGGFAEYAEELFNPSTEDLGSRLMNAAAVGFLGGSVTGGIAGGLQREPTKVEDPKAPPVDKPKDTPEADKKKRPDSIEGISQEELAEIDRRAEEAPLQGEESELQEADIRANFGDKAGDRFAERVRERRDESLAGQRRRFEGGDADPAGLETLTGAVPRLAQKQATERAQAEARGEKNEQRLQVTLRNVAEGRRIALENIPQSLLETGNVTPEENAAAAQEYEENKPQVIEPQVEVKPLNVKYDPETDEFSSRGKRFKYLSTLSDDQGRPEKIVARDLQNGKEKTFRSQRLVQSLTQAREGKVDQPSEAAAKFADVLQFDAMPAAIQQAVMDDADAVVSEDDTVDIATMVQAAQKAGLSQDLIDRTKAIAERQQTRVLKLQNRFTEKDEWREYQGPIAPISVPIEQRQQEAGEDTATRVSSSLGSRGFSVTLDSPVTLTGIKQFDLGNEFPGSMSADTEVELAIYDLLDAGMPRQVFDYLKRLAFHDEDGDLVRISGLATSQGISLSSDVLRQVKKGVAGRQMRWTLSHEMWHVLDKNLNISSSLAPFKATVSFENQTIDAGDVVGELYENYVNETELGKVFIYPFRWANEAVRAGDSDPQALGQTIQEEVFAQLGAIYLSNPELVQSLAPSAFEAMQAIAENPALPQLVGARDAVTQDTRSAVEPDPAGVPGEVRAPAVSRGDEVPDDGGGGDAGVSGVAQGEAGEGLGGQADTQDGDGDRRPLPEVEQPAPTSPPEDEFSPDELRRLLTGVQDVNEFTVADLQRVLSGLEALSPTQEEFTVSDLQQLLSGVQQRDEFTTNDLLRLLQGDRPETPSMMRRTGDTEADLQKLVEADDTYNQVKVRSLAKLQERIPLDDRIAGPYTPDQPLRPIGGGQFRDLDLTNKGEGLDISQAELDAILTDAIRATDTDADGRLGTLARDTVERLQMSANTVDFWDRALRLSDNARYWYEVSAEGMRDVFPDLNDAEIKQFISIVAATSPVANPYVNMRRAVATFANYLQGRPVDNDLVIEKSVTAALQTADLEGLKTGSFGGTMQLVLGYGTPTLSTNDRQVAATFGVSGEDIGKNPELYEVMSRFYMGLRDKLNATLPEGAQPFETWQLQALGWVQQRYKNEYVEKLKGQGLTEAEAIERYDAATAEEISAGENDVDDYAMSLLRREPGAKLDRLGAIQALEDAGIDIQNNEITREVLLDPRTPAALSPTTARFREKRTITAEINSLRNEIGNQARGIFDAAVAAGNTRVADDYHAIFATLLNKASQGATNPFTLYFKALGLPKTEAKPTRVATPTGGIPLAVGGSYQGDISPNIRVPVPMSVTEDQLNLVMTSLSKSWDQDAVPASHVIDMADGLREGYTETSQVFVETLEALSREQIEAFAAALPDGSEINFTRFPNGYEFNVLTFDQETFDPTTPDQNDVAAAADQMLIIDDSSITNISTKDAQFQPAGYSEIQNYDEVFASFKDSLYTAEAVKLLGKVQRKKDGKVKDLTEKQIVAALRRQSPPSDFTGQGNARIQRAHGAIKQRLSDLEQAEQVAQGLASQRDTRLKLFIQKNQGKFPDAATPTDPAPEKPSFQRRLSGQTKSYDDAVADGTRLNGEPNTNELNLDDDTRIELQLKKWQDKYLTVKKLQEQAKEILGVEELPERLDIHGAETLSHGKIKNDYDNLEDNYVKPIGDILRENDIEMDDAALYLIAKHAKERNEYIASINESLPDGGSGLTTAAAAEILENAENKDALEEIARLVYDMLEENRKRMADAGLLSEDTVDGYREQYQFYVPLKGFAAITVVDENGVEQTVREQSPVSSGSTGRGFSITGKEVFKALGRESRSDNPLLYALRDTEEKIVRSRKNEVSQRFLELVDRLVDQGTNAFKVFRPGDEYPMKRVERNGRVVQERMSTTDMRNDTIEGTKDPKYMSVKVGGEEVFIEIKSPALNRAMQNLGAQQYEATFEVLNKSTTSFLQKFQNFRRNMLINYNPSWFLINPVRDIQTGIMFSLAEESKEGGLVFGENLTADILKNYIPVSVAYFANLRGKKGSDYDAYFEEYQAAGAPTGQTLTREIEEQQQRLENIIAEGSVKSKVRALGDLIEDANTASENAVRFAAYIAARDKGVTVQKAALLAKNMTVNFNRKGEASSAANLFYLFFNAAVQGTDQIVKAMSGRSPTGGLTKAQIAGIAIATSAYAITKHNIEASDEDDDGESLYNDLAPYDKLMSWNFVRPDGKTFFQLPLPYGYGLIHTIGRLAAEYEHDSIDGGEVASELTAAFVHHMLPPPLGFLGASGEVAFGDKDATELAKRGFNDLVPDIFEFPATVATNMNHFGAPIYIEDNPLLPPAPDSSKAKRSAERGYRVIAESMNKMTGGSLYRTGGVDVSPDVLKYAVDFFGGGLGRFITRGIDTAMINNNDINEDDRPLGEFPIFRYLYGEPSTFNDKLEYYDNIRDSQEVFKENEGTTDPEERERFLQRFGSVAQLEPLYKETQKKLRALRKKKKQIEKTQSDPSLAYTQIQKLEAEMEKLYDQYNKRYREAAR